MLDTACLVATLAVVAIAGPRLTGFVKWSVGLVGGVIVLTLGVGMTRVLRGLGDALAEQAFPRVVGLDLALAPRTTVAALFRALCAVGVLAPALAVLVPFLPLWWGSLAALVVLLALLASFVRKASDFDGHFRAGAEVVAEALSAGATSPSVDTLHDVRVHLPELGAPVACLLPEGAAAVGATLGALNVRGVTGATVLAIHRAGGAVVLPAANERLLAGDVLALAGSEAAVEAARALLLATGRTL